MANSFYANPQNLFDALGPGLPWPSSFPSAAEVRRDASECSRKIFDSYRALNQILMRHEETLRKRWTKRTKDARRKLLLAVRPSMPERHRPDFRALERESPKQLQSGSKFQDSFLFPSINLDDLSQPRPLLLMLNSRGRNLPCAFAHADFEAIHVGHVSGAIQPAFLNEYTMLLHGQTTPETYGKLLSWDEHELAFEWMLSGLQFHPGMGLLVLQIQQGVLEFLVLCCRKIMQDLPFDSLTDSSIPVQPEPATLLPNETAYTSLAALAADAPYRVPAHLDFRHIRSLAAARSSAASDHIYALREDPGYFSSVIGDYSEHRQETLLDTNGKRHDVLKEYLFWDRVVGSAIDDAYTAQFIFDTIHKKLPKQYQQALLNFNHFLDVTTKGLIPRLKVGVPPSPPLRSLFVREPQEPNTTKIVVRSRQIASRNDELLRLFQLLWDDQQLFLYGLPNLMDELERLVESDRKQKQRLSGWVQSIVSDLALLAQMKNQLTLYQPWASTFENDALEHGEAIKADYTKSMSPVTEYVKAARSLPSVGRLVTPLRDKSNYPIDKPRTRQSSDAMRAAEKNLDLFWKVIDQHFNANCRSDVVKQLFSGQLQLQRTPEWVEPVNSKKPTKEEAEEGLSDHFSRLSSGQEQSGFEAPLPKNKVKTHGPVQKGGSHGAETPEHVPRTLIPDQQQQVIVGRRAFKVFSTLFHVPNQTDTPGDVAWPDFLHAMASTGFQIVKLYGSVWQFTPTKLNVENSIHFHEPHPIGKIPFRMARRHGRRLHRTYGWTGNTFSLA
ncbi:hypothetical protein GJ744_009562 [Endocarpon pusillum]|uniref:Uncharacterized protein n=1 Tax=Endocarpon pusillum TaxID=364733 RepID=A0A8H7E623_9EURO|nr:hypothetical protein GJ744_009562 [Endocarpon pusillum]